ncbi:hypothetical protein PHMEG_00015893 [Phytophthora megakarya]|uniref:Uncharacterized protein n=1 Tax=Phytophthora megakarya TaxID=4795 RepID=A0A225W044_9STRA|nr:hypothetical protein PHMEG_00015893 [Phytophthora megakarya]
MSLVDVAVLNAYIVLKETQKRNGGKPSTHVEFILKLHSEMLPLSERDFVIALRLPSTGSILPPLAQSHEAQECPEY